MLGPRESSVHQIATEQQIVLHEQGEDDDWILAPLTFVDRDSPGKSAAKAWDLIGQWNQSPNRGETIPADVPAHIPSTGHRAFAAFQAFAKFAMTINRAAQNLCPSLSR